MENQSTLDHASYGRMPRLLKAGLAAVITFAGWREASDFQRATKLQPKVRDAETQLVSQLEPVKQLEPAAAGKIATRIESLCLASDRTPCFSDDSGVFLDWRKGQLGFFRPLSGHMAAKALSNGLRIDDASPDLLMQELDTLATLKTILTQDAPPAVKVNAMRSQP